MTPKEKVLRRFPDAKATNYRGTWSVNVGKWTRFGTTAAEAWRRASVMRPMIGKP